MNLPLTQRPQPFGSRLPDSDHGRSGGKPHFPQLSSADLLCSGLGSAGRSPTTLSLPSFSIGCSYMRRCSRQSSEKGLALSSTGAVAWPRGHREAAVPASFSLSAVPSLLRGCQGDPNTRWALQRPAEAKAAKRGVASGPFRLPGDRGAPAKGIKCTPNSAAAPASLGHSVR